MQSLGGVSSSSVGASSSSADQASAGGLQSSVGQQSIIKPQPTLMSYPGRVRYGFM